MYREYYRLQLAPFENTPDPRFFYDSEDHREALASTEYTVRMRKGLVLITGEIGSGKTMVSQALRHRLGDAARIALVRQRADPLQDGYYQRRVAGRLDEDHLGVRPHGRRDGVRVRRVHHH